MSKFSKTTDFIGIYVAMEMVKYLKILMVLYEYFR
jgi:hypothetical protein